MAIKQPMTQAEADVLAEVRRQHTPKPSGEGYSDAFDDDVNDDREMAAAAAAYAMGASYSDYARKSMTNQDHAGRPTRVYDQWPAAWDWSQYKPTTARRDLVKAAALCINEIKRLDRAEAHKHQEEMVDALQAANALEDEFGGGKCGCH